MASAKTIKGSLFFFFPLSNTHTHTHREKKHSCVWNQMDEAELELVIKEAKGETGWQQAEDDAAILMQTLSKLATSFKWMVIREKTTNTTHIYGAPISQSVPMFSSSCLPMHSCISRPVRCNVGICLDSRPTSNDVKPHIHYHKGYQPKYKEVCAAFRC